jgi:hypothetical protein
VIGIAKGTLGGALRRTVHGSEIDLRSTNFSPS